MFTGAGLSGGAILLATALGGRMGPFRELLEQPAAWSVPAAFLATMAVSRATASRRPPAVSRMMAQLHAPER
jgi:Na+(H+)/acetate symporter ActP